MTLKTIILRHRRENLRKCSLRGLEEHPDLLFYTYPIHPLPLLSGYIILEVGAPPLTIADQEYGLLLIDGTWRLAETMRKSISQPMLARSLPSGFKTAYPRKQTGCPDPESGLASVEALYLAHKILKRSTEGLLNHYYWEKTFLDINADFGRFLFFGTNK
jgi:pre-rRNA-processing protein TSR3